MKNTNGLKEKFIAVFILSFMYYAFFLIANYSVLAIEIGENENKHVSENIENVKEENESLEYDSLKEEKKDKKELENNEVGQNVHLLETSKEISDEDEIKLDEKIKKEVLSRNADSNGDGILSKAELRSYNLKYFSIDVNNENLDLKGIEYLENIEHLSINNIKENMDFSVLKNLKNLEYLYISGNFWELSSLKELNQVKTMSFGFYSKNNEIIDFSKLGELLNVERISINGSGAKDLSPLGKLKNLKSIDIQSNDVIDFEQIRNISTLESFSTLNSEIKNFDKIIQLKNLKELDLSNVRGYKIKMIENLTGLEKLYLHGCIDEETIDFRKLKNLKNLSLSFNRYDNSSTEPIYFEGMQKLEDIYINSYDNNTIVDFKGVDKLNKLKEIRIDGDILTNTKNIGNISKIPNLELLRVYTEDYRKINVNIKELVNPNLRKIEIYGKIEDISPLTKLKNLEEVTLNNSALSEIDIEKYLNDLEKINVEKKLKIEGTLDEDIGPILCGQTKTVDISQNALIRRFLSKDSSLYNSDKLTINSNNNSLEKSEINRDNYKVNIKAKEFGNQKYSLTIERSADYYNTSKVSFKINYNLNWVNKISADDKTEISIPDKNLKTVLLEMHDIDKDKKITKNDMINIEELDITDKSIVSLEGLQYAENLNSLYAAHNEINDLEPLRNLTKLYSIVLNCNKISSIDPLRNVGGWGALSNNYIEDITPLENGSRYTNIDLCGNYIDVSEGTQNRKMIEKNEDSSFFVRFLKISQKYNSPKERDEKLNIKENMKKKLIDYGVDTNDDKIITKGEMNDFNCGEMSREGSMFKSCKIDLSNLGLEDKDIDCLKYLNCITELDLSGNNLTDVSPLKYIGSLSKLNLKNNKINLETLKELDAVIDLDLSYNNLEDISKIANLDYLGPWFGWFAGGVGGRETTINLSHNNIQDISVLNKINSIFLIDLSYNQISDISAIENFDFSLPYDDEELENEPFTIDLSYNYIKAGDKKAEKIVDLFGKKNAIVNTSNQYIKLTDEKSKVQISTIGDITVEISVKDISKQSKEYKTVAPKLDGKEVLYAANISIVDGEYNGKIAVTIPVDSKFNGYQVKVLHQKNNGSIEEFSKVVSKGKVNVEVDELSPFFVTYDKNQIFLGDVNKDGKITLADYTKILAHVKKTKILTEEEQALADVNQDGKVTLADYTKVLAHVKKTKLLD